MRSCKHISVDRGRRPGVVRRGRATTCARGELVGIFPEATISRSFLIKELKTGAMRIAAEAGVPLIPVILWGTQRIMTKDHPSDFSRHKTIIVTVGEPLHPHGRRPGRPRPPSCTTRMVSAARRGDPRLPRRRAAPGLLVAPRVVRRLRADARGGRRASTPRRSASGPRKRAAQARRQEEERPARLGPPSPGEVDVATNR